MSYQLKILNHPADLRIEVEASSLEELFQGAIELMASLLYKRVNELVKKKKLSLEKDINIEANSLEQLMVDSLNEVLSLSDINNAIFPHCEINDLKDNKLKARILGIKVKRFDLEIKAATYYGLKIETNNRQYKAIITFDI
ncbi:MAG: archease [Minisyncoccia bacterium]|jgi:SHS2 domain-containing protein